MNAETLKSMTDLTPIWVVIATYNERDNVLRLIPEIYNIDPTLQIMIVDDNSPDGTSDIVRDMQAKWKNVHLLTRPQKLGYGTAMVAGFDYALRKGAQAIVTMDADFSHDPTAVPLLLDALSNYDLATGSRYMGGIRVLNWSLSRLLLSFMANKYVNFLLRIRLTDLTSGFRAYRAEALERINYRQISSRGYAFLVEVLWYAQRCGLSIVEVPIVYTERRAGQSKMSEKVILEAAFCPLRLLLKRFLKLNRFQ